MTLKCLRSLAMSHSRAVLDLFRQLCRIVIQLFILVVGLRQPGSDRLQSADSRGKELTIQYAEIPGNSRRQFYDGKFPGIPEREFPVALTETSCNILIDGVNSSPYT